MIKTRGISQAEVFEAATKIAASGAMPTVASIRQNLGRGSETTLHKYLQEWKSYLLKSAARIGQNANLSLLKENNTLRQNLEELSQNLNDYSSEMQNLEQANAKLELQNSQLMQENLQQTATIASLQAQIVNMRVTNEHASHEYQQTLDKIIADKNQIIHSLQEEMRQTQADAIEKMREYSFKEHDLLIHERVKIINLQADVTRLKAIVSKVKDANLLVAEEESQPVVKNNRAQLLSELYAQKLQSDLHEEDELDANKA